MFPVIERHLASGQTQKAIFLRFPSGAHYTFATRQKVNPTEGALFVC